MIPRLNDKPKYEMTVPSTGQEVKFRPYLVKEEKVLMMAFESNDQTASLNAVADTIKACTESVDIQNLKLYDVEYMFTKIRAKSVGEVVNLQISCKKCEHKNPAAINIDNIEVNKPEVDTNIIELSDTISVEMEWPKYQKMIQNNKIINQSSEVETIIELIADCIVYINTESEKISVKDEPREQLMSFIESMTNDQFGKLREYVEKMPSVEIDHTFKCTQCGEENAVKVRNISDFF